MAELPDIWRKELWHPMVVHFPIVMLLLSTIARIIVYTVRSGNSASFWIKVSRVLLFPAIVITWITVYTGSIADGEVVRNLCDPTVLETHENLGYTIGILFTIAAAIDTLHYLLAEHSQSIYYRLRAGLILLLMVIGTATLFYEAHLGASLVYQQGAGVYHPTEDCREFE